MAPFVFPGTRSLAVAERICIFIVLAASYDMLLGYTGIVSFAHTMFFGMGAYGVAIALTRLGPGWGRGPARRRRRHGCWPIVVAVVIGLLSLRVRAIFFAMITLAVASFAQILASTAARLDRRRGRADLLGALCADAVVPVRRRLQRSTSSPTT